MENAEFTENFKNNYSNFYDEKIQNTVLENKSKQVEYINIYWDEWKEQ